jgi:hypothetical protein
MMVLTGWPVVVQPWYMHPLLVVVFSGILPFGAVSVELFFIMSALWLHQFYYIFGSWSHSTPHTPWSTSKAYQRGSTISPPGNPPPAVSVPDPASPSIHALHPINPTAELRA